MTLNSVFFTVGFKAIKGHRVSKVIVVRSYLQILVVG